jgi:hypothetical protein
MRNGFQRVYSDDQREAFAIAYVDGGMTAPEVIAAAGAGLLKLNGKRLPPFKINSTETIKHYAKELRKRRVGNVKSSLPDNGKDALGALKRRLLVLADQEISVLERQPRGRVDLERVRLAARAMREAAALPEAHDPTPPAPGQRGPDGKRAPGRVASETKALGPLLAAARTSPRDAEGPATNGGPVEARTS